MFRSIGLFTLLFAILSLMIIHKECWADMTQQEPVSAYGFRIGYDLKGSYWFTSDDDDSEEGVGHALDYKPELIPIQALQGDFLWHGSPLLGFYYETAFASDRTGQDTTIEVSKKESSSEKINAFLDLFFLDGHSNNSFSNLFSRLRLGYKHHLFFGKADVQETMQYIAANSNAITLNPGNEIRFKSDFQEISVNMRTSEKSWVGIYQGMTIKPHEASTQVTQVLETEITGTGIKYLTASDAFSFDANVGVVKFRANQGNFRSDGFETLLHFIWRPRIYLIGSAQNTMNNKHNLVMIPLMGLQFSMQTGGEAEGQESDGTGELAMDIIVDAGLQLKYQF